MTGVVGGPRADEVMWADVRGRRLRIAVRRAAAGAVTRDPLLLLNGIGAPIEVLQPFVDALPADLQVIRFDVPGVGESPLPAVPYHLTTLAPLVGDLLTRLGHRRADVLGYSWGGGLAQQFAVTRPDRCRRLVLACTGTGVLMVPGRPTVLARMLTARRYRDPEYARRVAAELYGGSMRAHPERAAQLLRAGRRGPDRGYLYQLLAGVGWSSLPVLPLIRQPTLIVAGDDDPLIPTVNARIMQRAIPDARTHLYEGGHLALLTEAADLAPVIDDFLR